MDATTSAPDAPRIALNTPPRGALAARHWAMPAHTNPAGDIFGGWIMAEMDAAAGMTATRLAGGRIVTAAVSNIVFIKPVKVGDAVCFYTEVKRIGRSSATLDVEVWVLRHGCDDRIKVSQAEFTFVAIGHDGRPRPIVPDAAGNPAGGGAPG